MLNVSCASLSRPFHCGAIQVSKVPSSNLKLELTGKVIVCAGLLTNTPLPNLPGRSWKAPDVVIDSGFNKLLPNDQFWNTDSITSGSIWEIVLPIFLIAVNVGP